MADRSRVPQLLLAATLALHAMVAGATAAAPKSPEQPPRTAGADQFATGKRVVVAAPVAGDLIAAAGTVALSADVGGDAVIAGGRVRLEAPVGQNLYLAAGYVTVDAAVRRNARIAGGSVDIGPRARIAGNLSVGGGDIRMSGTIGGDLQAAGGEVRLDGVVGGDVDIGSGSLELGPNARIAGRLRYASRNEIRLDPRARVEGGIERLTPRADWPVPSKVQERAGRGAGWVWSVGLAMLAALLAALLPGVAGTTSAIARERWAWSLLIGFIAVVCIPVAALIAMLTVIGVPAALATLALYLALLLAGYAAAGIALGNLLLRRIRPEGPTPRAAWHVGAAAAGMLAISLLGRLPWVGGLVVLAALLIGCGALLLQLADARRNAVGTPGNASEG